MSRTLQDHLTGPGPKRILSLDGGGVRGLITLGLLSQVENLLAARSPDPKAFRLSDYFDLIGGTSTGAIIATLLAFGKRVEEITKLYFQFCPRVFSRRNWLSYLFLEPRFNASAFRTLVDETFDALLIELGYADQLKKQKALQEQPTLGSPLLKTGLAIVMKRIERPSVWALTNNPRAKYWDPQAPEWRSVYEREAKNGAGAFDANRDYALRRLVRASASAPFFLEAVEVPISASETGLFLDGGASPFNNPSQELFLMTTLKAQRDGGNGRGLSPFGFGWETGADKLLMLSLGTGIWREVKSIRDYTRQVELKKGLNALSSIISDCSQSSVTWMQALSRPRIGTAINAHLGDMRDLYLGERPLLTYQRISPTLETQWLEPELGPAFKLSERSVKRLRELDWAHPDNLECLHRIGVAMAGKENWLSKDDFPAAFDPPELRQTRPAA